MTGPNLPRTARCCSSVRHPTRRGDDRLAGGDAAGAGRPTGAAAAVACLPLVLDLLVLLALVMQQTGVWSGGLPLLLVTADRGRPCQTFLQAPERPGARDSPHAHTRDRGRAGRSAGRDRARGPRCSTAARPQHLKFFPRTNRRACPRPRISGSTGSAKSGRSVSRAG
jgi:hypothetical protein